MASENDIRLTISLRDLASAALSNAEKNLKGLQKSAQGVSQSVFNLKSAFASLGAGIALKDVVSTFSDFDDVMRQVGAVSQATDAQMAAMSATAKELGAKTAFSAAQAGDGLRFLAMAGFSAESAITALPGVLSLASAGSLDLGQAADIASNMLTAYNMSAEELPRVNDVMVQAFTSSNSTLVELGEAFKYVAPIAAGVGIELEGLVAPMALLHNAGIKGSMAGTALRGAIDALMSPTAAEAKLMADLGARIGGAGLKIKDSEGKFVGFASVIEQLEKAGITASEALNLFGLRAGPGMQALVSQGSVALREFESDLVDSGEISAEVAKQMEAGIGGAIRAIMSAWEGLKISLGAGLESAVTQTIRFFTDEIRNAIIVIEELKASGKLDEWANAISASITTTYESFKTFSSTIIRLVDSLNISNSSFLRFIPTIISIGAGAKIASVGLGLMGGSFAVITKAMPLITGAMSMIRAGLPQVGAAALNASYSLAALNGALAGVGVAWSAIKFFEAVEAYRAGKAAAKEAAEGAKAFQAEMIAAQNQYAEFANIQAPPDVFSKSLTDLKALGSELQKSKVFWTAVYVEERVLKDETDKVSAKMADAKKHLDTLNSALSDVKTAMSGYASNQKVELDESIAANQAHVSQLIAIRDQFIVEKTASFNKELVAEQESFKAGEISYAQYQKNKKTITTQTESEIHAIRIEYAGYIAETAAIEAEIAQQKKAQALALIQEQMQAELMTISQAAAQRLVVEQQYEAEIANIKKTTEQAVQTEREKILKESVDKYIASMDSEIKAVEKSYNEKIKTIEKGERKGTTTHNQALNERLKLDVKYYTDRLTKANKNLADAQKVYGAESNAYAKALKEKEAALKGYETSEVAVFNRIKNLNDIIAESRMSSDEKINSIRRKGMTELALYKDKEKEYYDLISRASKMARTDTEKSIELYNKAMDVAADMAGEVKEGEKLIISEGDASRKAINLIKNAQSQLESVARGQKDVIQGTFDAMQAGGDKAKTAVDGAAGSLENLEKKSEIGDGLKKAVEPLEKQYNLQVTTTGAQSEVSRFYSNWMRPTFEERYEIKVDTSEAESRIADLRADLSRLAGAESSSEHTVEIKGKASPVRGFTETMNNVSQLMRNFQTLASNPSTSVVTISANTGTGPQSFTAATQQMIVEYDLLKADIERKDIKGQLTFGEEMASFQQSADLLRNTYSTLYMDLSAGVSKYSNDFAVASSGITMDFDSMTSSVNTGSGQISVDLSTLGTDTEAFADTFQEALVTGNTEAFSAMTTGLSEYGTEFSATMSDQIDAVDAMAEQVIADGEEMISALADQLSQIGEQIKNVEAEILEIGKSTEDILYERQQALQSDYENWLQDRAKADELYLKGKAELEAGNFEQSKEFFLQSQELAESLAREVTDANGEAVMSLEDTTGIAVELVQQAGVSAADALIGQKEALIAQQEETRNQLTETEAVVDSVKNMSDNMTNSMRGMMAQFNANMSNLINKLVAEVSEMAEEIKSVIEEPMTPELDLDPIQQQYKELADTQAATVVHLREQVRGLSSDFDNYISRTLRQGAQANLLKAESEYKRLSDLAGANYKTTVNFTGKGSSERPLSEKIREMSSKVAGFTDMLGTQTVKADFTPISEGFRNIALDTLSVDDIPGFSPDTGRTATVTGLPDTGEIKDYGKVELQIGGDSFEVMAQDDIITTLIERLRRERLEV